MSRLTEAEIRAAMARYGCVPMTRREVAAEKALIEKLRDAHREEK